MEFLDQAIRQLGRLSALHPDWMAAGAFGVTTQGDFVDRVWDVTMGRELGGKVTQPVAVSSFDELLLVLRRDGAFAFDPGLPHFHLYGTDLPQMVLAMGRTAWVVDLPVVHNNRPIVSLGGGYTRAYRYHAASGARVSVDDTCGGGRMESVWIRWKSRARRATSALPRNLIAMRLKAQ